MNFSKKLKIEMMKKVMILSAAAFAICLAMPQLTEAKTVQNQITVIQTKAVKYQEITAETLPEAVTKSLAKDYAGFAIDKVFQGDDGTYKVAISKGGVKKVLYYSNSGEFIKAEKSAPAK